MLRRLFHSLLLALILTSLAAIPIRPVAAGTFEQTIRPESLLNPDGSLHLDGSFSGVLDLDGWKVQMDAERGPILSPATTIENLPANVPDPGNWEGLGEGGSTFNYYVSDIIVAGTDIFVSGGFQNVDSIPEADYIARWDGSAWHSLGSDGAGNGSIKNTVYDLYHDGTYLYAGGNFNNVNNNGMVLNAADYIARWDGTNWSALGAGSNGSLNGNVRAIISDGGSLYVSGSFTNVNNNGTVINEADYIAKWNGSTWSALGNNGAGNGAINQTVWALGMDGGKLYASGTFTNAATISEADCVAMWDGSNWSALGDNGAGNGAFDSPNSYCYELAVDSTGKVYVGGNFNDVNNGATNMPDADNFVMWNGSAWSAVGTDGVNASLGQPSAIVIDASDNVYVGGYFSNVKNYGTTIPTADKIAKWDGTNWSAFGSNGAGDGSISKPANALPGVFAMAFDGTKMYVGGFFEDVNNEGTLLPYSDHFILWNTDHWEGISAAPNGTIQNENSPMVNTIVIMGTDVYIGGSFTDLSNDLGVNDVNIDNIAKWDGSAWSAVGTGLNGTVYALYADGTDLYAGGFFINAASNSEADYLAKWNGSTWSAVGHNGSGNGSLNNGVFAITKFGGELYIGGTFTDVVNVNASVISEADYIARWSGSNWRAVNDGAGTPISSGDIVYALEASTTGVYVGGNILDVDGIALADYLAFWDGANWSAVGDNGAGSSAISGLVRALEWTGTELFVGGSFEDAGGIAQADRVAKWNGTTWSALGSNLAGTDGSLNAPVRTLSFWSNRLYVGGEFTNVSDSIIDLPEADYIAMWDGAWHALGNNAQGNGSLNNAVHSIAVMDAIYAGGLFINVNNGGTVIKTADYISAFGIDISQPSVISITRASTNPSSAASVNFTVTFSENVIGVDTADFIITKSGSISGETVTNVSGSGSSYTVTINTGTGTGSLRLDIPDTASIQDLSSNPLNNIPFTSGEVYTKVISTTYKSNSTNDGWILESTETSNTGGTLNSAQTTFILGDDAANKQYRAILHFDTSALPDTAVVTNMTLKIKQQGSVTGTSPFTFGSLYVDMRNPAFGTSALELADFNSAAKKVKSAIFNPTPASGWFSARFNNGGNLYVNRTGISQLRLYFSVDDNNNNIADFIRFFSGNAAAGDRPKLMISYYVP